MHSPYATERSPAPREWMEQLVQDIAHLIESLPVMKDPGILLYDLGEHRLHAFRQVDQNDAWMELLTERNTVKDLSLLKKELAAAFQALHNFCSDSSMPEEARLHIQSKLAVVKDAYEKLLAKETPFETLKERLQENYEQIDSEVRKKSTQALARKIIYHPDRHVDKALQLIKLLGTSKQIGEIDSLRDVFRDGFSWVDGETSFSHSLHSEILELVGERCHDYLIGVTELGDRPPLANRILAVVRKTKRKVAREEVKELLEKAMHLYVKYLVMQAHLHKHRGQEMSDDALVEDDLFYDEVQEFVFNAIQKDFPNIAMTEKELKKMILIEVHAEGEWRKETMRRIREYKV